jgi:galactoside O-acetyltransferase
VNEAFLARADLEKLGLKACGRNVLIHNSCVLVNCAKISIGDNVRIDAFTLISVSGGLEIGSHLHISTHVLIVGNEPVVLSDFANLASGSKIFSSSDDFSRSGLLGPTLPADKRATIDAPVTLARHVVVGAGSIVLPGAEIGEGATVGALSLVKGVLKPWTVYAGVPARPIKARDRTALELEKSYLSELTRP